MKVEEEAVWGENRTNKRGQEGIGEGKGGEANKNKV